MSEGYDLESPSPPPPPPPSNMPGSTVDRHVACVQCSYDLIGAPVDGACPECGTRVGRSLLDTYQLENCSRAYIKKLHTGSLIIVSVIALWLVMLIVGLLGGIAAASGVGNAQAIAGVIGGSAFTIIASGISSAVWLALLFGWWLLSEEDPAYAGSDRGSKARLLLRIGVAVSAGVTVVQFVIETLRGAMSITLVIDAVISITALLAWALGFFASMVYLRWLAPRIPDEHVYKRSTLLMWLGPILMTVGMALCGLGPVIALVLYWNLIDWLRKDLKRILKRQAQRGITSVCCGHDHTGASLGRAFAGSADGVDRSASGHRREADDLGGDAAQGLQGRHASP